jgi:methionine-rich copper-binding protein CopC
MARIIVLHMSAQFMHAGAHDIIWVEHTVHACSQAEQASIQACMTDMSMACMPGIDIMSFDMAPIIIWSICRHPSVTGSGGQSPACRQARPRSVAIKGPDRLVRVMSHTLHKPLTARLGAVLAALLLTLAALVLPASPAQAHDELLGSDPAADSTLDALPAALTLTFSGEIADDEGASVVEVTDAGGTSLTDGTPTVRDNVLTQPLAGEASGAVTVLWKVVSSDGHPISGELSFTVEGAPAPSPTPTETTTPAPTDTAAPTDTPTATPTATSTPVADEGSSALPWIIAGVLALALIGAIVYLLVSRSRREKTLAEGSTNPAGDPSQPGSEPPADH